VVVAGAAVLGEVGEVAVRVLLASLALLATL
jgi:hypothetical protein